MENEICPILIGFTEGEVKLNEDEVEAIKWLSWSDFLKDISENSEKYSPWCKEQVKILANNERFQSLIKEKNENQK